MIDGATNNLTVRVTYLKMTSRPVGILPPAPDLNSEIELSRVESPSIDFYRHIYAEVGLPWLWYERTEMTDKELLKIISDDRVKIYVLYVNGEAAGFAELDSRQPPNNDLRDIHLAYFGLASRYIGRGLGTFFINSILDIAWANDIRRIWLRTCSLDHPAALSTYLKAGFVIYGRETCVIEDPRTRKIIPNVPTIK
tara:strand:+ start:44 stop:631 length:588 start_codon:yes stop_codon:yes gene_type:complete